MEDTAEEWAEDWESQAERGETKMIGEHEDAEQTPAGASASPEKQTKKSASLANSDKASTRPSGRRKKGAKGVSALAAACRKHDLEAAAARSAGNEPVGFVNKFLHETVAADVDEMTDAENQLLRGAAAVLPTAQTAAQIKFVQQRAVDIARAEQETVQFMGASKTPSKQKPTQETLQIGASKTPSKRKPTLGRDTGGWDDYR